LKHHPFGAHVAVVEIDRETGEITCLRYAAVHDGGRIIHPKLVEGSMYSGMAQGVGQALLEGMIGTPEGQPLTGSLMDDAIPRAGVVPQVRLETMETPSSTHPWGVKVIGELPTVATPIAVANAVMDALTSGGVRHIDTPFTPEKIWRALHSVRARQAPQEGVW